MSRVVAYSIAVVTIFSLFAGRASALVIEQSVTPASVKEKGSRISVNAEHGKDGLIHFTITYRLPRMEWLVTNFEVRAGETRLATSHTSGFVHEESVTYEIAVSPEHLASSKFELSANAAGESGGQPVALPGGTYYHIDLNAFGKDAPAAKTD